MGISRTHVWVGIIALLDTTRLKSQHGWEKTKSDQDYWQAHIGKPLETTFSPFWAKLPGEAEFIIQAENIDDNRAMFDLLSFLCNGVHHCKRLCPLLEDLAEYGFTIINETWKCNVIPLAVS